MIRMIVSSIAAALLLAAAAAQPANSQKSKDGTPSGAHVAISLGDGRTIESKSGSQAKSAGQPGKDASRSGTDISPWTVTHGSSGHSGH